MSTFQYKGQGLRSVGAYQVSGVPWVTGSDDLDQNEQMRVAFPYVTKSVTVINTNTDAGDNIRVHFQSGSTGAVPVPGQPITMANTDSVIAGFHYITVPAGFGSVTFDVKCKEIYVSQTTSTTELKFEVFAELTSVVSSQMYHLTGSGITDTVK